MGYLSDSHRKVSKAQKSGVMVQFNRLSFDRKIVTIGLFLAGTVGSSAMAWSGEASDKVYFCLRTPDQELRCQDKNNRPYRMTAWHWERWGAEGRPQAAVNSYLTKASNPYKPLWSGLAFFGFATTGWFFRQLQDNERKLAQFESVAERQDVAVVEMGVQFELEILANENVIDIQKAELLGEADIKITQMEATAAVFEAETAGMSEDEKREYIDFLRQIKTPYLQGSQTLDRTIDPRDKVEAGENQAAIAPDTWVNNLIRQTALIWGNQGGGKSWLARHVAKLKKDAGYRVIVLDPDSNRAEWEGVESYHSWEDIENQIRVYLAELKARLQFFNESNLSEENWRSQLWQQGKATTLIIEEATTYSSFIKDEELLSDFGKLALTKSRKQEMPVTVVSHNNTQSCLFGIKGLHNLVSKMLQVECLAEVDSLTLQPKSTGLARVKLDSSNEWLDVQLPKLAAKITNFGNAGDRTSEPTPPIDRDTLERIYKLEFDIKTPETLKREDETLKQPDVNDFSSEGKRFTRFKLTRNDAITEISRLRNEMGWNQTQIIKTLWGEKPGGSEAYRNAVSEYKELMGGDGGE